MKHLIFIILLLSCTFKIVYAEEPKTTTELHLQQQIAVLDAQLRSTEKYQDEFLSVVLWSLGSVFAMTLGLAAFNWYSNKISYERDIQALKQESKAYVTTLEANFKNELADISDDLLKKLSDREENIRTKIQQELIKNINNQTTLIENQNNQILNLKFQIVKTQAQEAERSDRFEWAIYLYCDLLKISVSTRTDSYEAGEILDAISSLLDNPKCTLPSDYINKTIQTLESLPSSHKNAAEIIIKKIHKKYEKDA